MNMLQPLQPVPRPCLPAQPVWLSQGLMGKPGQTHCDGDLTEVERALKVLQRRFDERLDNEAAAGFPPDWARQLELSCSP